MKYLKSVKKIISQIKSSDSIEMLKRIQVELDDLYEVAKKETYYALIFDTFQDAFSKLIEKMIDLYEAEIDSYSIMTSSVKNRKS